MTNNPNASRDVYRSENEAYRYWIIGQSLKAPVEVTGVAAQTAANDSIMEIPYLNRIRGAFQVWGTFVGTIKIQGTLLDPTLVIDPVTNIATFKKPSADADYVDIATVTGPGITQLTTYNVYSRVRAICSAYTSGTINIRFL